MTTKHPGIVDRDLSHPIPCFEKARFFLNIRAQSDTSLRIFDVLISDTTRYWSSDEIMEELGLPGEVHTVFRRNHLKPTLLKWKQSFSEDKRGHNGFYLREKFEEGRKYVKIIVTDEQCSGPHPRFLKRITNKHRRALLRQLRHAGHPGLTLSRDGVSAQALHRAVWAISNPKVGEVLWTLQSQPGRMVDTAYLKVRFGVQDSSLRAFTALTRRECLALGFAIGGEVGRIGLHAVSEASRQEQLSSLSPQAQFLATAPVIPAPESSESILAWAPALHAQGPLANLCQWVVGGAISTPYQYAQANGMATSDVLDLIGRTQNSGFAYFNQFYLFRAANGKIGRMFTEGNAGRPIQRPKSSEEYERVNGLLLTSIRAEDAYATRAMEILCRINRGLIEKKMRPFLNQGLSDRELHSAAYEALIRAALLFEPSRGVKFSSYAGQAMHNKMLRALRDHHRRQHGLAVPFRKIGELNGQLSHSSLDANPQMTDTDLNNPEQELSRREMPEYWHNLPPDKQRVLAMRLGLAPYARAHKFDEIAEAFEMDRATVTAWIKDILAELREEIRKQT